MMIGRTEGASSSYVNYQLNAKDGSDGNGTANVSEAIRGKTIGERNQEALDAAQKGVAETDAYQVELSDRARNLITYTAGSVVQLSGTRYDTDAGWTREEERAALEQSIGRFRKMNENFERFGTPYEPEETRQQEEQRWKTILAKLPQGTLAVDGQPKEIGLSPVQQNFAQAVKESTGLEGATPAKAIYTPVTEIRTEHFRWTEETGIEETVSKEEEIAAGKTALRQILEDTIAQDIEDILSPHKTYEEAYDALYGEKGVSSWTAFDTDKMSLTMTLKPAQGAFGNLANHLNNYLEEIGANDSFYHTLSSALDELDAYGENELVNQIRKMVETSRKGQSIDTTSEEFEEEVTNAIKEAYGGGAKSKEEEDKKKAEKSQEQEQGMTFLEMQRRAAEEEGRLLDELLGKEHETGFESAGEVLARREPERKDTEFTDKLRRVDEREEPAQPFVFAQEDKEETTEISKDQKAAQDAVHNAWTDIRGKFAERLAAGNQEYFENTVKALEAAGAAHVDLLA